MNDKEFMAYLHKQIEKDRAEQGFTTMQILKKAQKEKQKTKLQSNKKSSK